MRHFAPLLFLILLPLTAWSQEPVYLDVSIALFEQAQGEADSEALAAVRSAESRYMPTYLALLMANSQQWGAVRILPESDPSAELMIEGRILDSDSSQLRLAVTARDASGRVWLEREYQGEAVNMTALQESPLLADPFRGVFESIRQDLFAAREALDPQTLEAIRNISLLRYAALLVPGLFQDYLSRDEAGLWHYRRLPADNDPMLARVREIRQHEYLFIDVVDAQFQRFFEDIKPLYDTWRRFSADQRETEDDFVARSETSNSGLRRGSYWALRDAYEKYRWARVQDQYLEELALGFSNEMQPTNLGLENSLYRLEGSMQQQYREWRTILAELLRLETGDVQDSGGPP